MTRYPVNYEYNSRDGNVHDGFAASEEEARDIILRQLAENDPDTSTDALKLELTTRDCGSTTRDRAEFERHWADEIKAGWVQPRQVSGGWKGEATCWCIVQL